MIALVTKQSACISDILFSFWFLQISSRSMLVSVNFNIYFCIHSTQLQNLAIVFSFCHLQRPEAGCPLKAQNLHLNSFCLYKMYETFTFLLCLVMAVYGVMSPAVKLLEMCCFDLFEILAAQPDRHS